MESSLETTEFHDIDHFMEFATVVGNIRSIQIQSGALLIRNHCLKIGGLTVNYCIANRNILNQFSINPNLVYFVLPSQTIGGCKWYGFDVPVNSIFVLHPHRQHQSLVPANWDSFEIAISDEMMLQESLLSENMWSQTVQPESAIFSHESLRIASLRTKLLKYFQSPEKLNYLIKNEAARLELKNWILHELRMIFIEVEIHQNQHNAPSQNIKKRYRTFSRALAMIEKNLTNQFSVNQLCDQIGVTPRTLQLCFKELSGISPHQYIAARKLHAVQQELFSLKNSSKSISHIAHEYGLLHAGRFSSQYK